MALPASGQITLGGIRSELENTGTANNYSLTNAGTGITGYVPINRNSTSKPNLSTPHNMSEWYSYNHTQNGTCSSTTTYTTPTIVASYLYYRINVTGGTGNKSEITITTAGVQSLEEIYLRIYNTYPFNSSGALTGSPVYTNTITTSSTYSFDYTLVASSEVLYFVINGNLA